MKTFEDFLEHNDPHVRGVAELLKDAKVAMDEGNISPEEFKELANDIFDMTKVDELSDSLERKNKIRAGLQLLREVISGLGSKVIGG